MTMHAREKAEKRPVKTKPILGTETYKKESKTINRKKKHQMLETKKYDFQSYHIITSFHQNNRKVHKDTGKYYPLKEKIKQHKLSLKKS